MKNFIRKLLIITFLIAPYNSFASSLSDDAQDRGINKTCNKYLSQIEKSYGLSGLNITFAHPSNPSLLPSLHISSQKFNNGIASFSATLMPEEEYCYISTVMVTTINNQSCEEIIKIKVERDQNLNVSVYDDGNFTILAPLDGSFQAILTKSGENSCSMAETRMMWPGR